MILLDVYIRDNEVLSVFSKIRPSGGKGSGERIHNGTTDAQKKD